MRVMVEPGARLRSAAATVAVPGPAAPESHACWQFDVAGELDFDAQPTIVAADARHYSQRAAAWLKPVSSFPGERTNSWAMSTGYSPRRRRNLMSRSFTPELLP
jgi:hypothetical protein